MFKKQIPNCVTLLNLLCGCLAILFAFQIHTFLSYAVLFIVLGAIFDFFDGLTARLLGVQSPIGKELDSLADVVTFGVAPGILVFLSVRNGFSESSAFSIYAFLPFIAFLIPLLSAYRLAKFNLDTRQTTSFIGLPVPANALFWCGLILSNDGCYIANALTSAVYPYIYAISANPWFLLVASVLFSILLISELPMFALKFKHFGWKGNEIKFIFLGISLLLLFFLNTLAVSLIIILYILISIFTSKKAVVNIEK